MYDVIMVVAAAGRTERRYVVRRWQARNVLLLIRVLSRNRWSNHHMNGLFSGWL